MKKSIAALAVLTCIMLTTLPVFADLAPVTYADAGGLMLAKCAVIAAIIVIVVLIVRKFRNPK